MDNRGQIHLSGETVAVLFISQEIGGQGQPTPSQHRDHTQITFQEGPPAANSYGQEADYPAPCRCKTARDLFAALSGGRGDPLSHEH
jgi:hypothetical protein